MPNHATKAETVKVKRFRGQKTPSKNNATNGKQLLFLSQMLIIFIFFPICIIKLLPARLLLFLRPGSTCFYFAGPISLMLQIALYITRTYKNVSALYVELLSLSLKEELRSFSFSHLFHCGLVQQVTVV